MEYVALTLSSSLLKKPRDLLIPLDIPLYILINTLIDALEISVCDTQRGTLAVVEQNKKMNLPLQSTLRDLGITFGQYLLLEFRQRESNASIVYTRGLEFDLIRDKMSMGCRSDVDIDLRGIPKQEFVSGCHAKIFVQEDSYYLTDENSKNGTKLNGKTIPSNTPFLLHDGDIIVLGESKENGIELVFKDNK